jgi:hypothetical protein
MFLHRKTNTAHICTCVRAVSGIRAHGRGFDGEMTVHALDGVITVVLVVDYRARVSAVKVPASPCVCVRACVFYV